jgi:predicted nucleic acid-binding protein
VETDVILAHVKEKDWLKSYADKILRAADSGRIKLCASCEVIHELYYMSIKLGIDMETLLNKIAALTSINMDWIPATVEISLTAMTLMLEYDMSSIFDAYYAATALLSDPDRTVISTDSIYERIPGIKRKDPREIAGLL